MDPQSQPNPEYQPFAQRIGKYLNYFEKVALVIIVIAIVLRYQNIGTDDLVNVGFWALAAVYFLFAFQRPEQTGEPKTGFAELLGMTVLPKTLWMGCAVSIIAVDFYVLNQLGYKPMMQVGFVALSISLLIFVFTSIRSLDQASVMRVLYRAIPIAMIDAYVLFGGPIA